MSIDALVLAGAAVIEQRQLHSEKAEALRLTAIDREVPGSSAQPGMSGRELGGSGAGERHLDVMRPNRAQWWV